MLYSQENRRQATNVLINGNIARFETELMARMSSTSKALKTLINRPPQREVLLFPRGKIALPATIHVAGLGEARGNEPYDNDGLKRGPRSFVLLKHTLAGAGRLRFEGRHFTLTAGKTLLLTVPHDHRYWLPRDGEWKYFWLCLHGHEAIHICKHLIETAGPVLDLKESTLGIAAHLVLDALGGNIATPAQASSRAYELITHLYDELEEGVPRKVPERTADLEQAIGFCREHLSSPVGVSDLADAAGYSRSHFGRRFRESEGISPSEFLRNERMASAAQLLADTDLPIAEIAVRAGYPDPSYFTKVFRRVYGVPPKAFRQSM